MIDSLDELVAQLCKIAVLNFDLHTTDSKLTYKLTECFMELCELMLLSENVKFSIEKVNTLPNKLYQTKFDCGLVVNLTKHLFPHSLFETVIFYIVLDV